MNLRTDSLFPLSVLALLAALTLWLNYALEREQPPDGKQRHDPDFIVESFNLRRLSPEGNLLYSMTAEKMVHFPDDDSTELQRPRLSYLGRIPAMHLASARAHVSKDAKVVTLIDEVFARREATADQAEMRFTTNMLVVYPDDEIAVTDRPVRIVQGESVVTGVGMELDNRQATLVLKSQVQASIEPKKR